MTNFYNIQYSLNCRLGSETFKSKLVCWSETPRWLETAEMVIQDVGDCPQMEVKLKDARSKELGRYRQKLGLSTKFYISFQNIRSLLASLKALTGAFTC